MANYSRLSLTFEPVSYNMSVMARPEREIRTTLKLLAPSFSERDRGTSLADDANDMLKTLDLYPERTDRSMLSGIEESLNSWQHINLADAVGRTPDQIDRYIKKGLPWQSREKMMPRIEALFVIVVTLDKHYGDNFRAKERILNQGDEVNIGGLSIVDLISIGETEIALALANRAITQNIDVDENQREFGIGDSF